MTSLRIGNPDCTTDAQPGGRWNERNVPGLPLTILGIRKVRTLIRDLSSLNVPRGAPRVHGELLNLRIDVSRAKVAKHQVTHRKSPSRMWRTFLENHAEQPLSVDLFVALFLSIRILYMFLVLVPERRRIVHFNVAEHSAAERTAGRSSFWSCAVSAPTFAIRSWRRVV